MKALFTLLFVLLTATTFAQKDELVITIANDSTGMEESESFGFGSDDAITKEGFKLFLRTRYRSYTSGSYKYTIPYNEVVLRATGKKVILKNVNIDYRTCRNSKYDNCDEYNKYIGKAKAKQGKDNVLFVIDHSYTYDEAKSVGFGIILQDYDLHKLK